MSPFGGGAALAAGEGGPDPVVARQEFPPDGRPKFSYQIYNNPNRINFL
jgi:hypothetical protein